MRRQSFIAVALGITAVFTLLIITAHSTRSANAKPSASSSDSSQRIHTTIESASVESSTAITLYLPVIAKSYPLPSYQWLSQQQDSATGLLPSQQDHSASTYNNSLTIMAFTLMGDHAKAKMILEFFNNHASEFFDNRCDRFSSPCSQSDPCGENDPCGFFQFRDARTGIVDSTAEIDRWMGDNAWLLMAIHHYQAKTGDAQYEAMADAIVKLLKSFQQRDGYIASGWGWEEATEGAPRQFVFRSSGHAEGNLDAYKALALFNETEAAKQVKQWLDFTDFDWKHGPLDLHSWRVLSLGKEYGYTLLDVACTNDDEQLGYKSTINHNGLSVTGFLPYPVAEYKDSCQSSGNIWTEGTGQMAAALYKAGYKAQGDFYVSELEKLLFEPADFPGTKALPYLATADSVCYPWVDTNKGHVAAVTWYLFAKYHFDPFNGEIIDSFQIANPRVKIEAENYNLQSGNVRFDSAGEVSEGNGIHIGGDDEVPNNNSGLVEYQFCTLVPIKTSTFGLRYADDVAGDQIIIKIDGVFSTTLVTADTEAWTNYVLTPTLSMETFETGWHTLTVEATDGGTYGLTIDYFQLDSD